MRRVLPARVFARCGGLPFVLPARVQLQNALCEPRKHFASQIRDGDAPVVQPPLWSLAKEAEKSSTLDDLLGSLRANDANCAQFSLDFALFETRYAAKFAVNNVDATEVIGKLFAKLVGRLELVQSLSLVVSSPIVLDAVLMMLSFSGSSPVTTLNITSLEVVVYDQAFQASTRRDEEESAGKETVDSLATLLNLLGQRCPKVKSLTISQVNLESFARSFEWDRQAVHSLANLISASAATLEHVDLSHVPLAVEVADDGSSWSSSSAYAELSAALGRCVALQHLDLRGQHAFLLRSQLLRKDLANLAQLKSLNLSSSHINDVAVMHLLSSLRTSIGSWGRLEALGMDQGGLTAYSVSLMAKDLDRYASGEDNETKDDDSTPQIRSLSLASNALAGTSEDAFSLSSVLTRCEELTDLNLRHNSITGKHAGVVISGLARAVHMRKVQLHSNRIGDNGLIASLPYTKNWVELQELDLTRCRLTSFGLLHLSGAMHMWEMLTALRLSRNDFRRMGDDLFAQNELALKKRSSASSTEKMSLFVYDPSFMQGDTENRYRGGEKVPTSFELDRRDAETGRKRYKGTEKFADEVDSETDSKNALGDLAPFVAFGESLAVSRSLRVLDLSDCALAETESFAGIVSGVKALPLTELCLAANPLFGQEANVHSLANALRPVCGHTLRSLDLSGTQLGDLGITILCEGAEYEDDETSGDISSPTGMESSGVCMHMGSLEELRLSSCGIGRDGFASLAVAVPFMTSLRRLFLDGNVFNSVDDVSLLLEALSKLPSLEFVGLSSHNGRSVPLQKSSGYDTLRARGVYVHH